MKKNIVRIPGIFLVSLLFLAPIQAREYQAQFFTINLKDQVQYREWAGIGISQIIVRSFQDDPKSGGLYFKNTRFRTLTSSLEEILQDISSSQSPLKVCAWMIARRFNWTTDPQFFDYQYHNGRRQSINKYDIFNPQALEGIAQVFKELAAHPIAAILIQDDLILRYNEGFSNWGKAVFTTATQLPAQESRLLDKNSLYYLQWQEVKISQVNKTIALIVKACKEANPGIKVGMNVYYETPYFPDKARTWYSHDLSQLLATGLDYIYLMSYQRQIKSEMHLNESQNRLLFRRIIEKAFSICGDKLVVKIQVRDWQTGLRVPLAELKAYLDLVPPEVKTVCFTPVKPEDFSLLKELIGPPAAIPAGK